MESTAFRLSVQRLASAREEPATPNTRAPAAHAAVAFLKNRLDKNFTIGMNVFIGSSLLTGNGR